MSEIVLSICVPSLPEPVSQNHLANLRAILAPQLNDHVEIVEDPRGREVPTGTKRNDMYAKALGRYVCSVDCDDILSSDYVSEILKAIESNPDVVTFEGRYIEVQNNNYTVPWVIKLGEKYEARTDNGLYQFFRWPNHLVPMRKEIATAHKFPDIWKGEDYEWSLRIKNSGLLKTSVHIPKKLYDYVYIHNK